MSLVVTPIPRLLDLVAPAFTLGTANAAGSAATAVASDSTLLAFDAVAVDAITFGQSGSVGTATVAPRRDHVHAMESETPSVAASQAEMEAASSTTVFVTPGRTTYTPGLPTTYGSHDGGGNLGTGSVNLASTAQTATGLFTWTIATDYEDANYTAIGLNASQGNNTHSTTGEETAGLWYERCALANTGALQDGALTLAIIGVFP